MFGPVPILKVKAAGYAYPAAYFFYERTDNMAVELTANAPQTVAPASNALFTETPIPCNRGYVCHREGSGLVTLKGITNQCRARYKVEFGANIAVPAGGTAGSISVSLSIDGEPLNSATAIVTPAAVNEYFNVYVFAYIDAPRGCCVTVTAKNTSTQAILVQNANLAIERVA